jgi:hypothetical protein
MTSAWPSMIIYYQHLNALSIRRSKQLLKATHLIGSLDCVPFPRFCKWSTTFFKMTAFAVVENGSRDLFFRKAIVINQERLVIPVGDNSNSANIRFCCVSHRAPAAGPVCSPRCSGPDRNCHNEVAIHRRINAMRLWVTHRDTQLFRPPFSRCHTEQLKAEDCGPCTAEAGPKLP